MKKSKVGMVLSLTAMINSIAVLPGMTADGAGGQPTSIAQALPDPVTGTTTGDSTGASSKPGTTGSSSANVDTEHWPWMEQESPKARWDSLKTEMPTPKATTDSSTTKKEKPIVDSGKTIPPPEPLKPAAGLTPERAVRSPETATVTANAASTQKNQPMRLYGRIEQIETRGAPTFPIVLKAESARMDNRQTKPLQARATEFSGRVVSSFPADYSGTWGGKLQVQQMQVQPHYYQIDPDEARRTVQAVRVGATGSVNFEFQNLGSSKVALAPAQIMFMVPGRDTMAGEQVKQMLGQSGMGNMGAFGGMIDQMVQNMPVPLVMHFGDLDTQSSGMGETGVSGNQLNARVLKNDIRQLAAGVLEQQIVTQERTINARTHQARTGYGETVMRFTQRNAQQMYVQAASVDYDGNRQFLMKTVLAGWITKGQVMQTNPMAGMPGMMPGGMGGMGDLQKMLGPGTTQPGQMPQIPGLDPNMLKNLFGQ